MKFAGTKQSGPTHHRNRISKNRCCRCGRPLYNDIDEDGNHLGMVCLNDNCPAGTKPMYASGRFLCNRTPKPQVFPKEMKRNNWRA